MRKFDLFTFGKLLPETAAVDPQTASARDGLKSMGERKPREAEPVAARRPQTSAPQRQRQAEPPAHEDDPGPESGTKRSPTGW